MNNAFIGKRIAELLLQKNISAQKLSLELGHQEHYIYAITSKNKTTLPSLGEFLYICDYFKITPMEFFNESQSPSLLKSDLINYVYDAPEDIVVCLLNIAKLFK